MRNDRTGARSRHVTPQPSDTQPSTPSTLDIQGQILDGLRADIMNFDGAKARRRGHDIQEIIGTALKFSPDVRQAVMPKDSAAASPREVATALSEIGRAAFLPRHELFDVRLLADRFQVISGKIDPNSYKSHTYLGRDIKTAEIRFSHGLENSMGLSFGDLALIDPNLIRLDCNNFLDQLKTVVSVDPFAQVLSGFLDERRVEKQVYYRIAGLERLLKEELQHVKDAVFTNLVTGEVGFGFQDRPQDVLLKPHSPLRGLLSLDQDGSILGSVALAEYSSSLGGLIMELDQYLANQHYGAAQLAVIDFLTQQRFRSFPQPEGSMGEAYQFAALALFDGLEKMLPNTETVTDMLKAIFPESTPEGEVRGCRRFFVELYTKDFWSDSERAAIIASRR
jgi:hypothetical protein